MLLKTLKKRRRCSWGRVICHRRIQEVPVEMEERGIGSSVENSGATAGGTIEDGMTMAKENDDKSSDKACKLMRRRRQSASRASSGE